MIRATGAVILVLVVVGLLTNCSGQRPDDAGESAGGGTETVDQSDIESFSRHVAGLLWGARIPEAAEFLVDESQREAFAGLGAMQDGGSVLVEDLSIAELDLDQQAGTAQVVFDGRFCAREMSTGGAVGTSTAVSSVEATDDVLPNESDGEGPVIIDQESCDQVTAAMPADSKTLNFTRDERGLWWWHSVGTNAG